MVFAAIIIISFIFLNAIMMGYLERKIAGHVQRRPGPMEVGSHGILQLVVDGVKLVGKELLIPVNVDRTLFRLGPILSFTPVILPLLVIPFSEKLQARDLNLGLLFIVSMTSINVMAMLVAGWGSNNKYSMFGAMRAVAQSIAYEIPILLSMLAVVLMTNTFSLKEIVGAQQNIWFIALCYNPLPLLSISFPELLKPTVRPSIFRKRKANSPPGSIPNTAVWGSRFFFSENIPTCLPWRPWQRFFSWEAGTDRPCPMASIWASSGFS